MDDKYRSRKFALAVGIITISAAALFAGKLGGGEWVAVATLVMAGYAAGNVMDKQVQK